MKVAQALRDAGHDVHVITARHPDHVSPPREERPGFTVEAVTPWRSPREVINALNARRRRGGPSLAQAGAEHSSPAPPAGRVSTLKRWLYSLLWLPDDKQGFIVPAARAIRGVARRGPVVLYSSGPPFSVHLAALLAVTGSGVPWAFELRDPWTESHFRQAHQRSWLTSHVERWLERTALRRARLVVSVSEGIHRGLVAKLRPPARDKCIVIRNGIEQLAPPRASRPAGQPFMIAYVGSFYHRRDPIPFLAALAAVAGRHGLDATRVRVELVGQCRAYLGQPVEPWCREHGLGEIVTIRDWVPPAEALSLVNRADLLLLLAQDQPDQVPNKLYEYLGARVPILGYVDADGESARMLAATGGHYLVTEGDAGIAEGHLERALGLAPGAPAPPRAEVLEQWRTTGQMEMLVAALRRLAGRA